MSGLEENILGAKIFDFLTKKKSAETESEPIDLVDKVCWRDMDAETLKAFFRQWEHYAAEADAEAETYEDGDNYTCKAYNEGYRDAILDLIDDVIAVLANMPEPELDIDGWHK